MSIYSLYLPGEELSLAELCAAHLDGDLVVIGDAFAAADAPSTPRLRAASLAAALGRSLAATHLTAAWIHGALPSFPARLDVQRAVPVRLHRVPEARVRYRDVAIPADDLVLLGGVRVTTIARTLVDLARTVDPAHEEALPRLARLRPAALGDALAWLDAHPPVPHKRRAIALLRTQTGAS